MPKDVTTETLLQKLSELFPETAIHHQETLQELWSGYGNIARYKVTSTVTSTITSTAQRSLIVKTIAPPPADNHHHPRGWNTQRSHQRKLHSYQVEALWYQQWASRCDLSSKVPTLLGAFELKDGQLILLLEDLDAAGFDHRHLQLEPHQCEPCLAWLAAFHATFVYDRDENSDNESWPNGLWKQGGYWHLNTRPDEWQAMNDSPLKTNASRLDQALESSRYQTLIHGDAKLANFCFHQSGAQVAAVDFQYVGGGCGVKDVMYFLGSCLSEQQLFEYHDSLLSSYFRYLSREIQHRQKSIDCAHLEAEWRQLNPLAWADFQRFLEGWSPGHKKNHGFSQHMTQLALSHLASHR